MTIKNDDYISDFANSLALVNLNLVPCDDVTYLGQDEIAGTTVDIGKVSLPQPTFDHESEKNSGYVLVRVNAFSCNYRDKAIIVRAANKQKFSEDAAPLAFFGSDFVGTIVKVGPNVVDMAVGDRVIPDCSYPAAPAPGVAPGVTTNEASRGWLRLHSSKLLRISRNIPIDSAAAFSIGGQTSQSLIRRTVFSKDDKILVTSARSNTSMFVIQTLVSLGLRVTAVSTSTWTDAEKNLVSGCSLYECQIDNLHSCLSGNKFDVVIDPYFDLYLKHSLDMLEKGGRYITCGYKNQHGSFDQDGLGSSWCLNRDDLLKIMINNLSIIGNCIGTKDDLRRAVEQLEVGDIRSLVDSSYGTNEGVEFLHRTFSSSKRLGKSVCILD